MIELLGDELSGNLDDHRRLVLGGGVSLGVAAATAPAARDGSRTRVPSSIRGMRAPMRQASAAATSPLKLVRFDGTGAPVFNFTGPATTFIDDASLLSRWQMQIGLRYLLN